MCGGRGGAVRVDGGVGAGAKQRGQVPPEGGDRDAHAPRVQHPQPLLCLPLHRTEAPRALGWRDRLGGACSFLFFCSSSFFLFRLGSFGVRGGSVVVWYGGLCVPATCVRGVRLCSFGPWRQALFFSSLRSRAASLLSAWPRAVFPGCTLSRCPVVSMCPSEECFSLGYSFLIAVSSVGPPLPCVVTRRARDEESTCTGAGSGDGEERR